MYKIDKGVCLVNICGYDYLMTTRDHPNYSRGCYQMNAAGVMYWHMLEEGRTIEEISAIISSKYKKPENEVAKTVSYFFRQLYEMGYLVEI